MFFLLIECVRNVMQKNGELIAHYIFQ